MAAESDSKKSRARKFAEEFIEKNRDLYDKLARE